MCCGDCDIGHEGDGGSGLGKKGRRRGMWRDDQCKLNRRKDMNKYNSLQPVVLANIDKTRFPSKV